MEDTPTFIAANMTEDAGAEQERPREEQTVLVALTGVRAATLRAAALAFGRRAASPERVPAASRQVPVASPALVGSLVCHSIGALCA